MSESDATGSGEQPEATGGWRTAYIRGTTFHSRAVQYTVVGGLAMVEGDIVLGDVETVEAESETIKAELRGEIPTAVVLSGTDHRWAGGEVPYDIDPGLARQERVTDAIAHWQEHTGFRFTPRDAFNAPRYPDYVTFRFSSEGCSSTVGRAGGQQFVNLGDDCTTGNAIHEIGHTVGLWHEQSREDRDAHVTVHWDKIQKGMEHNFDQHITDGDDVGPYDFGSIMHYPLDAFSVDGSQTLTPVGTVPAGVTVGQRVALSAGDIAATNLFVPTLKEAQGESAKETNPETVKETQPETLKERGPETVKEANPETVKEGGETIKETAETIKERSPETIKERFGETTKELHPETAKERLPEALPPHVGGVPFALRNPSAGGPAGAAGLAGAGVAGLGGTTEQPGPTLAAVFVALEELQAQQTTMAGQLAIVLQQLGYA